MDGEGQGSATEGTGKTRAAMRVCAWSGEDGVAELVPAGQAESVTTESGHGAPVSGREDVVITDGALVGDVSGRRLGIGRSAGSYTLTRAQETKADLVCRLQLVQRNSITSDP